MVFTKTFAAVAALLAVTAAATAAQAAVEVFTDRTAFEAAISNSQTYGFDGLGEPGYYTTYSSVRVGAATFTTPGTLFAYNAGSSFDHYSASSLTAQSFGKTTTMNVSISDPSITAIGFDFGSYSKLGAAGDVLVDGVDVASITTPGGVGSTGFIGFLSTDAISSVSFSNVSSQTLDLTDLTTGMAVAAAPEPSEWVLMIVGVGMAGAALRRRRRIQPAAA